MVGNVLPFNLVGFASSQTGTYSRIGVGGGRTVELLKGDVKGTPWKIMKSIG